MSQMDIKFDWTKTSKLYDNFEVETYFSAWSEMYVDYLQTKRVQKGRLKSVPVDLPKLPFEPSFHNSISASRLIGNEEVYGNYLRAIIEHAYLDGQPFSQISGHFLTDIQISSAEGPLEFWMPITGRMHTPSYAKMVSQILAANEGKFLDYEYQDGVVEGVIKNNHIYFLDAPHGYDGSFELDDQDYNICFRLEDFQSKLVENQSNVNSLLKSLTKKIGCDVWSTHPMKTPHFKADDWHPERPFGIDEKHIAKKSIQNLLSKCF